MKPREVAMLALAGLLGFVGGWVSRSLDSVRGVTAGVARAERFELVDKSGAVIAFWGVDQGRNTVLAFIRERRDTTTGSDFDPMDGVVAFTGQSKDQAAALGLMSGGSPFLNLLGHDGRPRAIIYLTEHQKPVLVMGDEKWEARLMLGFAPSDDPSPEDDAWALQFRHPNLAHIGVGRSYTGRTVAGSIFVSNGKGKEWRAP